MPVEVICDDGIAIPDHSIIEQAIAALTSIVPKAGSGEICVRLCGREVSQELNSAYRGKDAPTNVLSFPAEVELEDAIVLGDIAICMPVVAAEAAQQGKSESAHLTHLVIHGVLHLLGYDHVEDQQAAAMEALEIQALAQLGIANPYLLEHESDDS